MNNVKTILLFCLTFLLSNFLTAQKINQFDQNNKRTGVWKKYYPNKTIRYEGEFKNGKEIGVFKFYRKSYPSFPSIIKSYSTKNDSVKVEFYSKKGKIETTGFFINKERVGAWKYYFEDGKIMSEEFYNKGKLEGKVVNYYPNEKPTEITFYKDGLKHGLSKKYSSDGVLLEEINYKLGKANGLAKYFELNGNLKEKGLYQNGKRVGKWEYFLDGEVTNDEELKKKKGYKKSK